MCVIIVKQGLKKLSINNSQHRVCVCDHNDYRSSENYVHCVFPVGLNALCYVPLLAFHC